jgi:hypothetical protein
VSQFGVEVTNLHSSVRLHAILSIGSTLPVRYPYVHPHCMMLKSTGNVLVGYKAREKVFCWLKLKKWHTLKIICIVNVISTMRTNEKNRNWFSWYERSACLKVGRSPERSWRKISGFRGASAQMRMYI